MLVDRPEKRNEIRANFLANELACQAQPDERARICASLKLADVDRALLPFAIFCDLATGQGFGLGRHMLPERLEYSRRDGHHVLAARAAGLGVGWVSIPDPRQIGHLLGVP